MWEPPTVARRPPGRCAGKREHDRAWYEVPTWQTGSDGLAGGLMLCRVLVWHLAGDMRDQRLPVWCQHANCNGGQQSSLIAPWAFLLESTSQSCRSLDRCASHTFDGSIGRDMKRATLDLISARRLNRRHTCSLTRAPETAGVEAQLVAPPSSRPSSWQPELGGSARASDSADGETQNGTEDVAGERSPGPSTAAAGVPWPRRPPGDLCPQGRWSSRWAKEMRSGMNKDERCRGGWNGRRRLVTQPTQESERRRRRRQPVWP